MYKSTFSRFLPHTFLFLLLVLLSAGPGFCSDDREEKIYSVEDFTKIHLKGPYEVKLTQSSACRLMIEAPPDRFSDLQVRSSSGLLSVEWIGSKVKTSKNITLWIDFENLEKLEIIGAVDLTSSDVIRCGNLKIEFEGAGNVELELEAGKVISEISGVGNFELSGTTEYHKVEFSGVGKYDSSNLISKFTLVESNGVGTVKVYASDKFIGEANGVGSVDYYGDPQDVTISATGLGSIDRH